MSISFLVSSSDPEQQRRIYLSQEDPDESVNMSNANAAAMLQLMALSDEPCGEVAQADLDSVISRLLRVANASSQRQPHVRDTQVAFRDGTQVSVPVGQILSEYCSPARYIDFGISDQGIADRAMRLLALFRKAKSCGGSVCWG